MGTALDDGAMVTLLRDICVTYQATVALGALFFRLNQCVPPNGCEDPFQHDENRSGSREKGRQI